MMPSYSTNCSSLLGMIETTTVTVLGRKLHRLIVHPKGETKGGMIFFHGQGDFVDRYPAILTPFTEAGIRIILTDIPGHGRSPGKRGAVPGWKFIDELTRDSLAKLKQDSPELPIGMCGHSMGGMIALRQYLRQPQHYRFAWFSSPLLDPSHRVSAILKNLLLFIAPIFPWLGRSTGVTAAQCRNDSDDSDSFSENDEPPLYHGRISLGWAHQLMVAAQEIEASFPSLDLSKPILFTQGTDDQICPINFLEEKLNKLTHSENLTFTKISQGLHEPFVGDSSEKFEEELRSWVHSLGNPN